MSKCRMNRKELRPKNNEYRGNWGFIKMEYDGTSCDIAKKIKEAIIRYAEYNAQFCKFVQKNKSEFLMGWGERQNQGAVFHSLCQAFNKEGQIMTEIPCEIKRGKSRKSILNQRIDYWIHWENKNVLLIEYKHNCIDFDAKKFKKKDDKEPLPPLPIKGLDKSGWKEDCKKYDEAKKSVFIKEYRKQLGIKGRSLYHVVLMIAPIYHRTNGKRCVEYKCTIDEGYLGNILKSIERQLSLPRSRRSCLRGYWWLPEERQKIPVEWKENGECIREYYYGTCFIARIRKA